ncbi:shikimate kinase [Pararhodospirillum photometricum]|nr:shikimate kinase [Pararhodospirillum photometricum]
MTSQAQCTGSPLSDQRHPVGGPEASAPCAPLGDGSAPGLQRTVVLVGLMGAGKTCVGRCLARMAGVPFVDADAEIETAARLPIAEIFARYGEAEFRATERRVMERLLERSPCVLATGGGAFMAEETRALIRAQGVSLWLRADLETLVARTAGRSHRPLLNTGDARETLRGLMERRYPVYAEADVVVDTTQEPPHTTARRAWDALARTPAFVVSPSSPEFLP